MPPVKLLAEIGAATASAVIGILAAADSSVVTGGAVVAVFSFATLLVREVLKQHRTLWEMIDAARDDAHYAHWEAERLRFNYGERALDPGPYIPRRPPKEAA